MRLRTECPEMFSRTRGRCISDWSLKLANPLAKLEFLCEYFIIYCAVPWVVPAHDRFCQQHQQEQRQFEFISRRFQSTPSRYETEKKKADDKQEEADEEEEEEEEAEGEEEDEQGGGG